MSVLRLYWLAKENKCRDFLWAAREIERLNARIAVLEREAKEKESEGEK